jgi:hypothetical protein
MLKYLKSVVREGALSILGAIWKRQVKIFIDGTRSGLLKQLCVQSEFGVCAEKLATAGEGLEVRLNYLYVHCSQCLLYRNYSKIA